MFDILVSVPSSLKIILTFAAVLLIYGARVPLGISLALCGVGLAFWSGAGTAGLAYIGKVLVSPESVLLLVVILLLLYFTESLNITGRIGLTISALKENFKRPGLLYIGLPALIGLLPMPGGALFSAPLVASLDKDESIATERKTAINYWFRHIWEYWWPLYPGVVMAIKYSGLPLVVFYGVQMPLTLAALAGGYWFILRGAGVGKSSSEAIPLNMRNASAALIPILTLVIISVVGSFLFSSLGMAKTLANLTAMLTGLLIAFVFTFAGRLSLVSRSLIAFTRPQVFILGMLIVGVQIFSAALKCPLDSAGVTLVSQMRGEFLGLGIPLLLVMALIPFISGFVTGIAFGFVGASFPLVFGLLGASPPLNELVATTVLAYGFGYIGMMLSPVHTCFIVTNEYFKSSLIRSYRFLWGPVTVIAFAVLVLAGIYYLIF